MRHHCICLENAAWRSVTVDLRRMRMTVLSRSFSRVSTVYATSDRLRPP